MYHKNNDGGAAFDLPEGGHIYVSNSEIGTYPDDLSGGVYALTFDSMNKAVGYNQLLSGTAYNCHGGETPWGSWISCEEFRDNGRCWQGEFYRQNCFFFGLIAYATTSSNTNMSLSLYHMNNHDYSGPHRRKGACPHSNHWPIHGRHREFYTILLSATLNLALTFLSFDYVTELWRDVWPMGGVCLGC